MKKLKDNVDGNVTRVLMETRVNNGREVLSETAVALWDRLPLFVQFILPVLGIGVASTTTVFSLLEVVFLFVLHTDSFFTWGFMLTFEGIVLVILFLTGVFVYVFL